jgi:ferredoxin
MVQKEQAQRTYDDLKAHLHMVIRNTKSKTIGCKNCHSSIARAYVNRDILCPVCGGSLLCPTYKTRLDRALKNVERWDAKIPESEHAMYEVDGTCYLVGGWST